MLFEEERLVTVGVAPSQMIAEMWRDLLLQEGIPTIIQTSDGYAYFGALSPCSLLVSAYQSDRARTLLKTLTGNASAEESGQRRERTP